jgi:hypothetical protein
MPPDTSSVEEDQARRVPFQVVPAVARHLVREPERHPRRTARVEDADGDVIPRRNDARPVRAHQQAARVADIRLHVGDGLVAQVADHEQPGGVMEDAYALRLCPMCVPALTTVSASLQDYESDGRPERTTPREPGRDVASVDALAAQMKW